MLISSHPEITRLLLSASFQSLRWAWQQWTVVWMPLRPVMSMRHVRNYAQSTCRRASPHQREPAPATERAATKHWESSSTVCRPTTRTSCSSVRAPTRHVQSDGARPLCLRAHMKKGKNPIAWHNFEFVRPTMCASGYCVWKRLV